MQTVRVHAPKNNVINVFAEFAHALGAPLGTTFSVTLLEAIGQVPELHGLYVSLGHATRGKLLPIDYSSW